MNDIKFNKGQGGLGRALTGLDHVSGIVAFLDGVPTQVSQDEPVAVYSLEQAENLGITRTDGISSKMDLLHYHIENFYQGNPKGKLWLLISTDATSTKEGEKLKLLQNAIEGEARQVLICDPFNGDDTGANYGAAINRIQAACDDLEALHKPLNAIYEPNVFEMDLNALPDLRTNGAKNVSVVLGCDLGGVASVLVNNDDIQPTAAGLLLGFLSRAKVNENIGWVREFNANDNDTNEFDKVGINSGGESDIKLMPQALIDDLNNKGYIFLVKHIGRAGSYFNDAHTATKSTDDFAFIENGRTIDKAIRGVRQFLLPNLNAPLYVNADGTLTEPTIAEFKNDAKRALEQMQIDGEISAHGVKIDPAQNVLSTSKIAITIEVVPVGVARNIVVNIGLAVRVSA